MDNNKNKNGEKGKKDIALVVILILAFVALVLMGVFYMKNSNKKAEDNKIAYTELLTLIDDGKIEKIEMEVGSQAVKVKIKEVEEEKTSSVPSIQAFMELVQEKKRKWYRF